MIAISSYIIVLVGDLTDAVNDERYDIMMSYAWDSSRQTVLKIRDRLQEAGYRVWIDERNMGT